MKKLLLSSVLGITLAACTPQDLANFAAKVQAAADALCGVIPVAADIATEILAENPVVPLVLLVDTYAHKICQATAQQAPELLRVNRLSGRLGAPMKRGAVVVVDGVRVHVVAGH